jgi:hypothetical protein
MSLFIDRSLVYFDVPELEKGVEPENGSSSRATATVRALLSGA